MDLWRAWHNKQTNFVWDIAQYYSYLPAKFCNNNSFEFNNDIKGYIPQLANGEYMPKVTYGMSILYSPFFALGYKVALNQDSPRNGFSEPFITCIHWGSIFYGLLGLIFLRNFLIKFYNEFVVTVTLAIVFFGTNLFYYTMANSEMTHGYLFCLISAFLLLTYKWYQTPKWSLSLGLGLLLGLISLIRPTEILVGSIFIFWSVSNWNDIKQRLKTFLQYKWHLFAMAFIVILIWVPQFLFWKERVGSYFYFSYGNEKFFWTDPQIINILFSYRKGWITYSPLIVLVFIGFFFMKDEVKKLRPVILSLLIINIYVLSCWWDWTFGGSFGARCFTQHLAFLSLPIAAICNYFCNSENFRKSLQFTRAIFFAVVFSGISLSIGQTHQFNSQYIHYNNMTKETYWLIFGKYYLDGDNQSRFWNSLKALDDETFRSGKNRDQ